MTSENLQGPHRMSKIYSTNPYMPFASFYRACTTPVRAFKLTRTKVETSSVLESVDKIQYRMIILRNKLDYFFLTEHLQKRPV